MAGIYLGSTGNYAGKNILALALGRKLQKSGLSIGLMKPLATMPVHKGQTTVDEDIAFLEDVLNLEQPPELSTPVALTRDFRMQMFRQGCPNILSTLKDAYTELSKDKDLIILRGSGALLSYGKSCGCDGVTVANTLDLKVLLLARYGQGIDYDYILSVKEVLGDRLLGVVLNDVPEHYQDEVNELITPFLQRHGVEVFGVTPHDSLLSSVRVNDLAEKLPGNIIAGGHNKDKLVENFLIGTMQVENFLTYFKRQRNCAVIMGGDRSDLQIVALEGKAACLVLTGNLYPNDIILTRAEVEEIPVILAREDTWTVAKKMEAALYRQKLRDVKKITHCMEVIDASVDLPAIREKLGI